MAAAPRPPTPTAPVQAPTRPAHGASTTLRTRVHAERAAAHLHHPQPECEPEPEPEPPGEHGPRRQLEPQPLSNSLEVPLSLVRWLVIHGADGCAHRKAALAALAAGQVRLNGTPTRAPAQVVVPGDVVSCGGGAAVEPFTSHRHVLMHKPCGHISGRSNVRQLRGVRGLRCTTGRLSRLGFAPCVTLAFLR
jgi:hypothetical protein